MFNATSGFDAPTAGEKGYPPRFSLVNLKADADLDSTPSLVFFVFCFD
jgi:hypothetical protein